MLLINNYGDPVVQKYIISLLKDLNSLQGAWCPWMFHLIWLHP